MYLQYWGLAKNPFDSVPDPGMYFSEHATVETTVAELLFAIEEGNECLAVVVGEVGLGKTMAMRVVLDALDPDRYRIAFVTNPDVTFVQLLREIIGQLQGQPCQIRSKEPLLEEFNRILFKAADEGRKVLVFIDEGNAMKGANLEALRLLTNMQEDTRNLMTLILAGQPKLARMLEDPRRANLFQRIGVYTRLEPLESPGKVRAYVEHRLSQAGAERPIFTDDAYEVIFRHSQGIPRLINRLCKLSLKAGETNELAAVGTEVVRAVAARFETRTGKHSQALELPSHADVEQSVEQPGVLVEPLEPEAATVTDPPEEVESTAVQVEDDAEKMHPPDQDSASHLETAVTGEAEEPPFTSSEPSTAETAPMVEQDSTEDAEVLNATRGTNDQDVAELKSAAEEPGETSATPAPAPAEAVGEVDPGATGPTPVSDAITPILASEYRGAGVTRGLRVAPPPSPITPVQTRVNGNGHGSRMQSQGRPEAAAQLSIPVEVIEALRSLADERQQLRLAGQLAARQIQEHPERYTDAVLDPVRAWDLLRSEIMRAARCA